MFSWSHLSNLLSDPIRKQYAMSKRVQESNLKEGSAVAKPKPMNLTLSSMRKIPSQEVREIQTARRIKVWTRVVSQPGAGNSLCGPLTIARQWFSREATNDAKTWNTRKQGRRDESSAQPAAGNSLRKGEVHLFGRRKLEFHYMQVSDSVEEDL